MACTIYETRAAAASRLAEIGVAMEALQRAIADGHAKRIATSENNAPQMFGTYAWAQTLCTLRDELLPRGWRKADPSNFSLTINDARKINIVVESGDKFTRRASASPRTKSIKGLYIEAVALRNRLEADMFPDTVAEELRRVAALLEYQTYILLIHITDDSYVAELSLPDVVDGNQIVSWKERIFIPDTDDPFAAGELPSQDQGDGEIDIPVRRKA
jgi:hypothetical protein